MNVLEQPQRSQYEEEVIEDLEISGGLDLSYFRASSLIRASLIDCEFEQVSFECCNLEKARMGDCFLDEATFRQAQMRYMEIRISSCIEACFGML